MQLDDIREQLEAWFPAEAHKDRKLPAGGKWFYLSHQVIRDRLNDVCFCHWEDRYKPPIVSGDLVTVMCELTICGVTRTGIADSKTYPELNDEGKEKIIGSVVVNTARHAFRDAAEKFGVGAYLDSQKGKGQKAFITYMNGKGDRRAETFAQENNYKAAGAMGEPVRNGNGEKPKSAIISQPQLNRLHAIANSRGWSEAAKNKLLNQYGYQSSAEVTRADYNKICSTLDDFAMANRFNHLVTTS